MLYMNGLKEKIVIPDFRLSPRIDQVGVEERASRFTKRSIKKESKLNGLKLVLNMIDLTTLEGKDTELKVILETGELGTYDKVRRASDIAMHAGADFIKTSTGKIQPAATMPVTLVMLEAIRDFYYATGKMIGMKPAGGISKSKLALHYLVMVKEVLGEDWQNNHWFRFGASSLANDVLMQIVKEKTGVYQSANYFSVD